MKILKDVLGINELQQRLNKLENKVEAQEELITALVEAVRNHSRAIIIITDDFKQLLESLKLQSKVRTRKEIDDIYH